MALVWWWGWGDWSCGIFTLVFYLWYFNSVFSSVDYNQDWEGKKSNVEKKKLDTQAPTHTLNNEGLISIGRGTYSTHPHLDTTQWVQFWATEQVHWSSWVTDCHLHCLPCYDRNTNMWTQAHTLIPSLYVLKLLCCMCHDIKHATKPPPLNPLFFISCWTWQFPAQARREYLSCTVQQVN